MVIKTIKFSQFADGGDLDVGDKVVGLTPVNQNALFTNQSSGDGGSLSWFETNLTSIFAAVGAGYISQNALQAEFQLPLLCDVGDMIGIQGFGAGGWIVKSAGTQIIRSGMTFSVAGGTVESQDYTDNIILMCVAKDSVWQVMSSFSSGLIYN